VSSLIKHALSRVTFNGGIHVDADHRSGAIESGSCRVSVEVANRLVKMTSDAMLTEIVRDSLITEPFIFIRSISRGRWGGQRGGKAGGGGGGGLTLACSLTCVNI